MTIECYESSCPFHSCHTHTDEGPFCYETTCKRPGLGDIMEAIDLSDTHGLDSEVIASAIKILTPNATKDEIANAFAAARIEWDV
jgi:hypothetical protein